jgi:hypothetical protein
MLTKNNAKDVITTLLTYKNLDPRTDLNILQIMSGTSIVSTNKTSIFKHYCFQDLIRS